MSQQKAVYDRFVRAVLADDEAELDALTASGFRADLGGFTLPYTLSEYRREIARLRDAFSDFGQNVEEGEIMEAGRELVVNYTMTMTFDGILVSRYDNERALDPTDRRVAIVSQDRVEFADDGTIQYISVTTNLGETVRQMLGE